MSGVRWDVRGITEGNEGMYGVRWDVRGTCFFVFLSACHSHFFYSINEPRYYDVTTRYYDVTTPATMTSLTHLL